MITIENKVINSQPVLWVESSIINKKRAPLLLFWHGWTSMKEKNLHYAYMAAEKGYRVLLPEACGHGERLEELSDIERKIGFWKVVLQSISETEGMLNIMQEADLIEEGRMIVGGTSMGAVISLGALKAYPFIDAGVSLMGNPFYKKFAKQQLEEFREAGVSIPYSENEISALLETLDDYDLGEYPRNLNGRPVFIWHGTKDTEVPFEGAYEFYQDNNDNEAGRSLTFIKDPNSGHMVTNKAARQMIDWLSQVKKPVHD
jgi:fermentation-respiration switch protein FrsA (DUF1100 family)